MKKKVETFEMCCYGRMLKISWIDKVTNENVLKRVKKSIRGTGRTDLYFLNDMMKRKAKYAGHVLRGSSGEALLRILEGKVGEKKKRQRPKLTWIDNIIKWTNLKKENMEK